MIVQQVNLYQDSLKQKPISLGFYLGAAMVFTLFIGLAVTDWYLMHYLRNDREQVAQTLKQLAIEQERVKLLESALQKQNTDSSLITELEVWQKKVDNLNQTVEILKNNDPAYSQGFSTYFQALANQSISEVWLTVIHFDAEQQRINFEGSTFKSDKIPYFLQQLQKEPVFHGRTFAQLHIEKSEQMPNLMNFKLSTHLEPAKKDHAQ